MRIRSPVESRTLFTSGFCFTFSQVAATWEKVKQNPEVNKVLLSTGDLILKPDHLQEPNAPAAWHYYEILMEIRTQLQNRKR